MKVLLMQPLKGFVREPPNIPDMGLGYITTSLKKNGHLVHILDWNMKLTVKDFKGWLVENRPDAVGIKVFTKGVAAAKATIDIVRDKLPESIVVLGGPHPSAVDPEELMEDFTKCDFAIKGEAAVGLPSVQGLQKKEKATVRYLFHRKRL